MLTITPKIKKSARRTLVIQVTQSGEVVVRAPRLMPDFLVNRFVNKKREWILKSVKKVSKIPKKSFPNSKKDYLEKKKKVNLLIKNRLTYFNKFYNFKFNGVSIKNQSTRWGSCSSKGNLNFNYKIIYLTPEQQDYIVVHELCHLEQMNHSKNFWNLVEKTLPNFRNVKKQIKESGIRLG